MASDDVIHQRSFILRHDLLFSVVFFRLENLVYFQGSGILLIRNPFKAILSYYRHGVFGFHSGSKFSSDVQKNKENIGMFYIPLFEKFAEKQISKWRRKIRGF